MHLVKLDIQRGMPGPSPVTPALVGDVIWAHVTPGDALEHLRIRADGARMVIVLFIRAAAAEDALTAADALVARALTAPALRGWQLL